MSPRSLLKLDLKDLPSRPPTPVRSHVGRALVIAVVLLIAFALINALSASTDEAPHIPDAQSGEATTVTQPVTSPITLASIAPTRTHPSAPRQQLSAHDDAPADINANIDTNTDAAATVPMAAVEEIAWRIDKVKPGDTLSVIFKRHRLAIKDAYAVVELKDAAVLNKIRPGVEIQLAADDSGALTALRYRLDTFTTLHVFREDGRLRAEVITRTPEIRIRNKKAIIRTNLLDAAKGVGMDFETVYDLAQLFGWQVDFSREIRRGDQFSVIFEEWYLDDKKVGNGDILAAELLASNRRLRAIRHVDEQGRRTYYAPNGDGIQRSFLRSPLKFGRVTSHFSLKRFHPILKKWRAHRGADYGAPRGTPVLSTGDGVVMRVKRDRSYGKTVMIRHGGKYTTLYAHLHRIKDRIKAGRRVQQGEVIGYVGNTGWATGMHLHYEFRVNGIHRNPLTVELPRSAPIDPAHLQEFLAAAAVWVARLDQIGTIDVAQIDTAQ